MKPLRTILTIVAMLFCLAAGYALASLIKPATPPAPIIQPATGGPNGALLYWRYATQIPEELQIAAFNELADATPPTPSTSRYLVDAQPLVEGLIRASEIENCDFNLEYDQGIEMHTPYAAHIRSAARLLAIDARRLDAEGDAGGAIDRIAALLRMSAHLRSNRTLVSALMTTAVAALACDEIDRLDLSALSKAQRARLLAASTFVEEDDPMGFKAALAGEKRVALASIPPMMSLATGTMTSIFDDAIGAWDDPTAVTLLGEIEGRADDTLVSGIFVPSMTHPKAAEQQIVARLTALRAALQP